MIDISLLRPTLHCWNDTCRKCLHRAKALICYNRDLHCPVRDVASIKEYPLFCLPLRPTVTNGVRSGMEEKQHQPQLGER